MRGRTNAWKCGKSVEYQGYATRTYECTEKKHLLCRNIISKHLIAVQINHSIGDIAIAIAAAVAAAGAHREGTETTSVDGATVPATVVHETATGETGISGKSAGKSGISRKSGVSGKSSVADETVISIEVCVSSVETVVEASIEVVVEPSIVNEAVIIETVVIKPTVKATVKAIVEVIRKAVIHSVGEAIIIEIGVQVVTETRTDIRTVAGIRAPGATVHRAEAAGASLDRPISTARARLSGEITQLL